MFWKNVRLVVCGLCAVFVATDNAALAASAKKNSTQAAIQNGTKVRTKTDASGLYDQACYDAYYGCMDQFCISENESGGSCACSDLSIEYDKQFADIQKIMMEAERVATEEVEKVKAGANADIIFTGERRYDEDGNLLDVDEISVEDAKKKKRESLMAMWETSYEDDDEDIWGDGAEDFSSLSGASLYKAAEKLCLEQVPEDCEGDITLLRNMYSRQITSDCKGYENSLTKKRNEANQALAAANADVRAALKESFEEANKYDLGQCMVQFKKCMQTEDACGKNWENCVATIASENMQNNAAESTAGTKVATVETYDITTSTMNVLDSKRAICENVLSQCVAVRDMVWPAFLREAAPTIKVAEASAESKFRQSCLTNISNCIQNACKDDIVGKGVDTMDACLSRPDMARSFCKVEIDPCERMEPLIWGYVVDKLAAMRVDACTQEVKDCFTAETRCGENFQNCIGMDYDYIHDICPIDSLVVCKANNPAFSMDDLDSMLMGLYLNIDNAALDQCQELVDRKMAEVCGSTVDCNKFAADDTIGTGSLRSQKNGNVYRVTGMISFGSIKMGSDYIARDDDNMLSPGEIGVQEYIETVRQRNSREEDKETIIPLIEEELNNIAGTINRTIAMIEQDPEIQFCVNGRDLSQITGKSGQATKARFPKLLNQVKMQIAVAALRKAQDNYNARFNKMVADATKDASADIAQYMCQKMAETGAATLTSPEVDLAEPYAISYEVGSGLNTEDLTVGGHGVLELGGVSFKNEGYLGGGSSNVSSGTKETNAVFNRETRICHLCTTIITQSCKTTGSKSWFHNSKNQECTTNEPIEKCEDIPM